MERTSESHERSWGCPGGAAHGVPPRVSLRSPIQRLSLILLAAGASCGPAPALEPDPCVDHPIVVDSAYVAMNSGNVADCLVIREGSVVEVALNATITLRTRALVVEGPAQFISPSSVPSPPPSWISSGPFCVAAHVAWEEAVRNVGGTGRGADGAPGATLEIRYARVVGGRDRLALLDIRLDGGMGQLGRELRCGCGSTNPLHAEHVTRHPSGAAGVRGVWRLIEETP